MIRAAEPAIPPRPVALPLSLVARVAHTCVAVLHDCPLSCTSTLGSDIGPGRVSEVGPRAAMGQYKWQREVYKKV